MARTIGTSFLLIAFIVTIAGCGSGDPATDMLRNANQSNIQRLGNLYSMYQSQNGWTGPKSTDDFKSFLQTVSSKRLEKLGVDPSDIDNLFVSERDGEEFTFRFGVQGSALGAISPVVFEKTGVSGKRMVGFTGMKPKEVSEQSEFDDLLAGKFEKKMAARQNGTPPR